MRTGRFDLERFVALTSTNHAKTYGLYPRKRTIAIGSDADIPLWEPNESRTVRHADLHEGADYTPYEGLELTGWPTTVVLGGHVMLRDGSLTEQPGQGVHRTAHIATDATRSPGARRIAGRARARQRRAIPMLSPLMLRGHATCLSPNLAGQAREALARMTRERELREYLHSLRVREVLESEAAAWFARCTTSRCERSSDRTMRRFARAKNRGDFRSPISILIGKSALPSLLAIRALPR